MSCFPPLNTLEYFFVCFWYEIKGFAATHPCAARTRLFRLINTRNGELLAHPPIADSLLRCYSSESNSGCPNEWRVCHLCTMTINAICYVLQNCRCKNIPVAEKILEPRKLFRKE
jgi:hypothetical protein